MSCKWNAQGNFECFEQIEGFGLVDCESMKANSKNYMTNCTDVHCGSTPTTVDWLFATCPGYPTGGIKAGTGACKETSFTIRQNADQTYSCSIASRAPVMNYAPLPAPVMNYAPLPAPVMNYAPLPASVMNYAPLPASVMNYAPLPTQAMNYATSPAPVYGSNYIDIRISL